MPNNRAIIISTQNFPPEAGGIQIYMYELAAALKELGEDVRVICDGSATSGQNKFDSGLPFPVQRVRGPKLLRRYSKARKVLSQLKSERRIGRINALFTQVQQLWTAVDSFDTPAMQPNPADGEPATLKIYPPLSH